MELKHDHYDLHVNFSGFSDCSNVLLFLPLRIWICQSPSMPAFIHFSSACSCVCLCVRWSDRNPASQPASSLTFYSATVSTSPLYIPLSSSILNCFAFSIQLNVSAHRCGSGSQSRLGYIQARDEARKPMEREQALKRERESLRHPQLAG